MAEDSDDDAYSAIEDLLGEIDPFAAKTIKMLKAKHMKDKEKKKEALRQCRNWQHKCSQLQGEVNKLVEANLSHDLALPTCYAMQQSEAALNRRSMPPFDRQAAQQPKEPPPLHLLAGSVKEQQEQQLTASHKVVVKKHQRDSARSSSNNPRLPIGQKLPGLIKLHGIVKKQLEKKARTPPKPPPVAAPRLNKPPPAPPVAAPRLNKPPPVASTSCSSKQLRIFLTKKPPVAGDKIRELLRAI